MSYVVTEDATLVHLKKKEYLNRNENYFVLPVKKKPEIAIRARHFPFWQIHQE